MYVILTVRELFERGLWIDYCKISGIDEYAASEGKMDDDTEIQLDDEQVKELGI